MKQPGSSRLEWLVPLVIIGLTFFAALDHYSREKALEDNADQRTLQALKTRIELALDNRRGIVDATADVMYSSEFVSYKEFAQLALRLLPRSPDLYAIQWIPELRYKDLLLYREQARRAGFFGFDFKQLDLETFALKPVEAKDNDPVIAPIVYTEPRHLTLSAMGFDLNSSPARKRLLDLAKSTERVVISEPIRLVEDTQDRASFLLTTYVNNKSIKGWAMGVWRVPEFIDDALFDLGLSNKELILQDITGKKPINLYPYFERDAVLHGHDYSEVRIKVANREWLVKLGKHDAGSFAALQALAIVVVGFILAFASWYALHNARLRQATESEALNLSIQLQTEALINEQLEVFKGYLDAAPISVGILEGDRHSRRYTYVNDQMCETFGYSREQLIGLNATLNMFVLDEERDAFNRLVWASMDNDETFVTTAQMRLADGSSRHFELAGRYRREGEKLLGTLFYYDITERVKYEQAQAELLEFERKLSQSRKLQAMGNLLGGMAHSLNNQLQPILVLLSLLKRRHADDAKSAEYICKMEEAATSATDILQRTLATSRSEHGHNRAKVNDAVPNALSIALLGMPPNIKVNTSNMLSSESYISLDQVDLEVVLLNLVNNAKDAIGSAQGVIDISSYLCEPDADRVSKPGLAEQPWLCLCVKDNGMGMSVDQLSRVLDPFFTTKPVGQGTGLGLSETQGLVSRAGGYITINSEEGEGAEICLHLPLFETDDN
jgi:PAS domain S-box-containing protein